MKHRLNPRCIFALLLMGLCCLLLLAACNRDTADSDLDEPEMPESLTQQPEPRYALPDAAPPFPARWAVRHVLAEPINPYTTDNPDNRAVAGLVYEPLFRLDAAFDAVPVLAESISTADGVTYIITLRDDVIFHNDAALTAQDVLYSLRQARANPYYSGRLDIIYRYSRRTDEEGAYLPHEFELTLRRVHGNLPALLTFPIIQSGTVGWTVPPGTGEFFYDEGNVPRRLTAFAGHWASPGLPTDTIYLRESATTERMVADFNAGYLSMLNIDPTVIGAYRFGEARHVQTYATTVLEYIGFNINRPHTSQANFRQAVHFALDRAHIAARIMGGNAVPTNLLFHPASAVFDAELAEQFACDLSRAETFLRGNGAVLELEYEVESAYDAPPAGAKFELNLLFSADNPRNREIAVFLSERLAEIGITLTLDERPFEEYAAALQAGDFDLYLGAVRLQADFDLTALLVGELAFGGAGRLVERRLIEHFLSAGMADRAEAARLLSVAALGTMPITPIAYREMTVITRRDLGMRLAPVQEQVFLFNLD